MEEQLSFFDTHNNTFEDYINTLLNTIISEEQLPTDSLQLITNVSLKGDDKGKETSKTICICEPEYPPNPNKAVRFTIKRILKIEQSEHIELLIRDIHFNSIPLPVSASYKKNKLDKEFMRIIFNFNDDTVYQYIKSNVLYSLKSYISSSSFSCCSKFVECSDSKRCLHVNKLYATGCFYRMNLERGKIFYGKNKNN